MRHFVTGCAGFIGSTVVDRLLRDGHEVVGYDNFSTGQREYLAGALAHPRFRLVQGDLLDPPALEAALRGAETVIHLGAHADVRFGTLHPRRDLEQNTLATFHLLEAMRTTGAKRIAFASTGSVYGEPEVFPTPEDAPFPIQTSFYGASKLAGESLVQAYSEGFGFEGRILRFVSVVGERYSHGHIIDFYRQLREHPDRLDVLGDGRQKKSYLYVQDCVDGILSALGRPGKLDVFNLGTDEFCEVNDSIEWICRHLKVSPERRYSGGPRGWVGDSPFIFLDCSRLRSTGWKPTLTIREGVERTLRFLDENPWILDRRR